MTSTNFDKALQKGKYGEIVARELLESKGWVVYEPFTSGAHAFDMLAIKDKKKAIALDVKTKARMNKWKATGINLRHFETYKTFSENHNMPFWIVFVDELEMRIYGNTLQELEKPFQYKDEKYPFTMKSQNIRVWHLDQMKHIADLDKIITEKLIDLSQRNYEYE